MIDDWRLIAKKPEIKNGMNRELRDTLVRDETLTVESKSDRKPLPDRELAAAIVALANTEGGTLFLGVEDDGTVTGAHRNHQDSDGLAALIANKTNPSIALRADLFDLEGKTIVVVQVSGHETGHSVRIDGYR